jgi:EAL domain-containing protein (putative c-di-GMP-specific phosphodiesterase class I)
LPRIAQRDGPICFEITETAVIENEHLAFELLDALSAAGVEISIDDYGSGLSSLAYLKRIRAGELKIDRAFISDMVAGQRESLLVRSTIDLAHGLGMKVTAEGVEDDAVVSLLTVMGCDLAQGYGVGRPMPVEELLTFLDESARSRQSAAGGGNERQSDADRARTRSDGRNTGLRSA